MKKKVIVPIVLSSIGLLLGGLIYLGISSFPELLESEKSLPNKEANTPIFVDDTKVVDSDKLFAPNIVEAIPSLYGESEYAPNSNSEVTYIDAPSYEVKASVEISKPSFKESAILSSEPLFQVESGIDTLKGTFTAVSQETSIEEQVISNDNFYYSSYVEKGNENIHREVIKTKKARVNKNKSIRSNEALIETTLLVIGAVDIFSMILIHRRKHLFR